MSEDERFVEVLSSALEGFGPLAVLYDYLVVLFSSEHLDRGFQGGVKMLHQPSSSSTPQSSRSDTGAWLGPKGVGYNRSCSFTPLPSLRFLFLTFLWSFSCRLITTSGKPYAC